MLRPATYLLLLLLPAGLLLRDTAKHSGETRGGHEAGFTDYSCGAASDAVVQALERVQPDSDAATVRDALELLKTSISLCDSYGDAWYYRSLFEERLNNKKLADYALQKAKAHGSEAMEEQLSPFVLATPQTQGARLLVAPKTVPALSNNRQPQKWALVIGIGRFSDQGIKPLRYTTSDADSFSAALRDPKTGGFAAENVLELTDADATVHNIKLKLNWIARHTNPDDIVVIYVATHGSPRRMDSVAGINYLVAFDTEMFHAGQFNEDSFYATAFPMVELANDVATRMRSLRTLIVLDTCYSGGSFAATTAARAQTATAGVQPEMLERFSQGTGRIVMAASQAGEVSLESDKLGHGYFTYYLLQALQQSGGKKPLGQLFSDVATSVTKQAASTGGRQHPILYKSAGDSDFALNLGGGL